jgi:hypothetical protein
MITTSAEGATSGVLSYVSGITGEDTAYGSASGNNVDIGAKPNNAGEVSRYTAINYHYSQTLQLQAGEKPVN